MLHPLKKKLIQRECKKIDSEITYSDCFLNVISVFRNVTVIKLFMNSFNNANNRERESL